MLYDLTHILNLKKKNKKTPNSQKNRLDLWLPESGVDGGGVGGRLSKGTNFQL